MDKKEWKAGIADEAWKVVVCARDMKQTEDALRHIAAVLCGTGLAGTTFEQQADTLRGRTGSPRQRVGNRTVEDGKLDSQDVKALLESIWQKSPCINPNRFNRFVLRRTGPVAENGRAASVPRRPRRRKRDE